jgi:hypothetical protein
MFRLSQVIIRPSKEHVQSYQSARYTYITFDLLFVGADDDSRESKHVPQR